MFSFFRKHLSHLAINLEADDYLENFFAFAVFSIVAIRVLLAVTGYPQLGGEGFHVAHMLWGGLLMMLSIIILLSFLSGEAKYVASIMGGLGFGAFIDELGKFITSDNDYFFRPTFALIYIIFVFVFFGTRRMIRSIEVEGKDYTINALEVIKEVVLSDLDKGERDKALVYLAKSDKGDKVAKGLRSLLKTTKVVMTDDVYLPTKIKRFLRRKYGRLVRQKKYAEKISNFFVIAVMFTLLSNLQFYGRYYGIFEMNMSFWDWGLLLSSLASGILVLIGFRSRKKRGNLFAYDKYKQAVLVIIFFRQFFLFYKLQLSALFGLVLNITFLVTLQYLISQERLYEKG